MVRKGGYLGKWIENKRRKEVEGDTEIDLEMENQQAHL
jgi:hypothetical protein